MFFDLCLCVEKTSRAQTFIVMSQYNYQVHKYGIHMENPVFYKTVTS